MPKAQSIFPSPEHRAAAYAAFKYLERQLEKDGAFDPGFSADVSGVTVAITIPKDTIVSRSMGTDGKGHNFHTASQNLNGYAVLTILARVLIRFNQWKTLKAHIVQAIKEAVRTKTMSTQDKLMQKEDDLDKEIAELKAEVVKDLPQRKQDTVRDVTYSDLPPTITITKMKKAA